MWRRTARPTDARWASLVSFPGTCGCLIVAVPPLPMNRLRRAVAGPSGPARGRAIPKYIAAIIIAEFSCTVMSYVDTQVPQPLFLEPFVDRTQYIVNVCLGALTPGAVATPRQFRPPASWIWWGGAWMTWTARPRRGILHGEYMYLHITSAR
jgi:hypothetical protein